MKFETIATEGAAGAILAHGIQHGDARFKKGRALTTADVAALVAAGVTEVTVARLDADDVPEDEAAALLAEMLAGDGVRVASAFTGRANLYATVPGLFIVKADAIDAINAVDEAITVATLPAFDEVGTRAMLATIKVIPYAVRRPALNATLALARALGPVMEVSPYRALRVGLVSTALPQTKPSIHAKNRATLEARLAAAKAPIVSDEIVAHDADAVGAAIRHALAANADMVLIYSASAIADRRDVVPDGIERAGGEVQRFGMPVDPGNLLLLARKGDVPVVGLPGCARSPKLNGFDWVLQRLLAGLPVTDGDIGRMGVGGLLKEIPSRPQPRDKAASTKSAARIAAVVLAAGQSRRMGAPKQLAAIGGMPMLRRTVEHVRASGVDEIVVVTGHEAEAVGAALKGLPVTLVRNPDYAQGLSTSLKAGLAALDDEQVDGALIVLGDMPGVTAGDIDRMLAAFDPAEGRGIVVPVHEGKRGNPVLWGAAYFPEMVRLSGDMGAKHLLAEFAEAVCEVELGEAVLTDIDTPEQLKAFVDERG